MVQIWYLPPPKSNIDTKNDGFQNVSPFKYGYFGYLCSISGVYSFQVGFGGKNIPAMCCWPFCCHFQNTHLNNFQVYTFAEWKKHEKTSASTKDVLGSLLYIYIIYIVCFDIKGYNFSQVNSFIATFYMENHSTTNTFFMDQSLS